MGEKIAFQDLREKEYTSQRKSKCVIIPSPTHLTTELIPVRFAIAEPPLKEPKDWTRTETHGGQNRIVARGGGTELPTRSGAASKPVRLERAKHDSLESYCRGEKKEVDIAWTGGHSEKIIKAGVMKKKIKSFYMGYTSASNGSCL